MPAFRLYSQLQTFYGNDGTLLAGGYLLFYQAQTTTPADVYGDSALVTNNGPRVDLDASGRPEVAIWGDTADAYFVELYNSDDVKQGEEDDVEAPGGAGQTVPVPDSGEFLTGDGANFLTATIREVPDPTGQADDYLQTDGTLWFWAEGPETPTVPSLPITVGDNSFQAGAAGADFYLQQRGSDTAPSNGTKETTKAVTFATAYLAAPKVEVTPKNSSGTNVYVKAAVTTVGTTGFTVTFSTKTGGTSADNTTNSDITTAVDFDWVAHGNIADPT